MTETMAADGRTIALFPGAFRPPHRNHFETVRRLAKRPDIDEVVIIIANRCRAVPHTTKVLDIDVAENVWSIYLRNLPKVRVEVAAASAVSRALDYVERAAPGDNILLVVGEKEARGGHRRFKKLRSCASPPQVSVSVIEGAPEVVPTRATDLRAMLATGDAGYDGFIAVLPAHLSPAEQHGVWSLCRESMTERHSLVTRRISGILDAHGLSSTTGLAAAKPGKRDEIYRITLASKAGAFVKYANDTVASDRVATSDRKPRRRLKAEREAIKWLHGHVETAVQIPDMLCYDRTTRTLVLSEVCPGGRRLSDDLRAGAFDPSAGATAARFLAAAHTASAIPDPFWDDPERDLEQWRAMLTARTTGIDLLKIPGSIRTGLRDLSEASDAARTPGFRHLDFSADNLLVKGPTVGAIDFEMSANIGDPAYDVGTILGHYLLACLGEHASVSSQAALSATLRSYEEGAHDRWSEMAQRVVGFAAAGMLRLAGPGVHPASTPINRRVIEAASHLLAISSIGSSRRASDVLIEAIELATPTSRNQDRVGVSARRTARTVHRRSLKSNDPQSPWEGSIARFGDRHALTLEILGGEPRTVVDIYFDGACIESVDLDALGSAELTVGPGQPVSRVEVRTSWGTVLDGMAPSDVGS